MTLLAIRPNPYDTPLRAYDYLSIRMEVLDNSTQMTSSDRCDGRPYVQDALILDKLKPHQVIAYRPGEARY